MNMCYSVILLLHIIVELELAGCYLNLRGMQKLICYYCFNQLPNVWFWLAWTSYLSACLVQSSKDFRATVVFLFVAMIFSLPTAGDLRSNSSFSSPRMKQCQRIQKKWLQRRGRASGRRRCTVPHLQNKWRRLKSRTNPSSRFKHFFCAGRTMYCGAGHDWKMAWFLASSSGIIFER
jgi:hypothetical protein